MSDIMNNEQIFANCTEILSQIINDNSELEAVKD